MREAASPCPARRCDSDDEGGLYGRSGSSYGSAEEIQQTVITNSLGAPRSVAGLLHAPSDDDKPPGLMSVIDEL